MDRYKHWFWNSKLVNNFAQMLSCISSWLWHKQYKREKSKRMNK